MQEINIQNMNVELVAQMFKNYQSNVLFHLEGLRLILFFSRDDANVSQQPMDLKNHHEDCDHRER